MFITDIEGRLIASIPRSSSPAQDFRRSLARGMGSPDVYRPVRRGVADGRMATEIAGAGSYAGRQCGGLSRCLGPGGTDGTATFVHRFCHTRRSVRSSIRTGHHFLPATSSRTLNLLLRGLSNIIGEIRALKSGSIERDGNIYSFTTVDNTGWMTFVEQPRPWPMASAIYWIKSRFGPVADSGDSAGGLVHRKSRARRSVRRIERE